MKIIKNVLWGGMMTDLNEQFRAFTEVLSDEKLKELAEKHKVEDKRERKLPIKVFFWLMVLSASQAGPRGCLSKLVPFFVATFSCIFPADQAVELSKMAVSKKSNGVKWMFFRGVYNELLGRYSAILDQKDKGFLSKFKEGFIVDGSIIRINKMLEKEFKSVHKGQAALKLNIKFSIDRLVATKLQVTEGKRHDSRFNFVTNASNVLYLFDLGYWSFTLFEKIMSAGSFFVSRLKSSCNPLIVAVSKPEWSHLVGKRLSEIKEPLKDMKELDVTVQLSSAKKPKFNRDLRLVGLLHEGEWRFYVTNIFDVSFTPQAIYELYSKRWMVEIFFNDIKRILKLEHIFSKNKNGIMVEIYSALIFYLLVRILIALAAKKSGRKITDFSFKKCVETVDAFLTTHLPKLIRWRQVGLVRFFQKIVNAFTRICIKTRCAES